MPNSLCTDSMLTKRYQTTIPLMVRKALGLRKNDRIRYTVQSDGRVVLTRADQAGYDPALSAFLSFVENDISRNPGHMRAVDSDLADRVNSLVSDVDFDLQNRLPDEEE